MKCGIEVLNLTNVAILMFHGIGEFFKAATRYYSLNKKYINMQDSVATLDYLCTMCFTKGKPIRLFQGIMYIYEHFLYHMFLDTIREFIEHEKVRVKYK